MANRRLAAFAQQYLQYMLQSRLQEQSAANVYDRQERNAGLQQNRDLDKLSLTDDTGFIASRTGRDQYKRPGRALLGPLGKNISQAKTLADLPTETGLRSDAARTLELGGHDPSGAINGHLPMQRQQSPSIGGALPSSSLMPTERPDIAELIKQREVQKDSILNNYAFEDDRTLAMAEGTKEAEAKGVNDAANAYVGDVNKRNTSYASSALQSELEKRRALDPLDISKAGRIAGAQESAQLSVRYSPQNMAMEAERAGKIATAQALAQGAGDMAKTINEATRSIISLQPDLARMQELSKIVNTSNSRQVLAPLGSFTQTNPQAYELDSLADSISMRLANNPALGGNRGAQSEADKAAIKARLVSSMNSSPTAEAAIQNFNKWVYGSLGDLMAVRPGEDPRVSIDRARARIGLPPADYSGIAGGVNIVDPSELGAQP